jgi:GxxExxY protein
VSELLFGEEVYAIVGAAIEVHRELGCGFLEGVYQEAMEIELADRSISHTPQQPLNVRYKGRTLRKKYCADFVCFGKIVVEIKALDALSGTEEAQIINYLHATGYRVGILINFGADGKLEWKRYVN